MKLVMNLKKVGMGKNFGVYLPLKFDYYSRKFDSYYGFSKLNLK